MEPDTGHTPSPACENDVCNILTGMNKLDKNKFVYAQKRDSVNIDDLVPSNYARVASAWN